MRIIIRRICSTHNLSFSRISTIRNFASDTKNAGEPKKASENQPKELHDEQLKRNIIVEKYGEITTLNIDRRTTKNSLDEFTLKEMSAAIDEFDKDEKAKVLIFNGEGGTFCSGFDIDSLAAGKYNNIKDAASRLLKRPLCDKITIAAISGYAVAEGFELAIACDLRVVEDTCLMGFLGRRYGVPMGFLGGRRLTSLIGLSQALDLLLTGRLITGVEAHQKGLASKVTATGTALGEAVKLAKSILKFPLNSILVDKMAAIGSQLNPNSEESMRDEAMMQSLLGNAIVEMETNLKKFQKGVGKHGKFHQLSEVPVKDWEIEDSCEEIILKTGDLKEQDKPK